MLQKEWYQLCELSMVGLCGCRGTECVPDGCAAGTGG